MRILYGVVGEGMGHATRSRVVIEHLLAAGHAVRVVVSGRAHRFLADRLGARPGVAIEEIGGLSLAYDGYAVDRSRSLQENLEAAPEKLRRNLDLYRKVAEEGFDPELVVSDFESWAFFYALNHQRPLVSIDNMQVLNRCLHPPEIREDPDFLLAKTAVKLKLPGAYHYLVTSFFFPPVRKPRTTLVPPILRPEVLAARREPGDHVLVYQTSAANPDLLDVLARLPARFRVYGLGGEGTRGNVTLCPFSEGGFVDDLRTARAVVAAGGFSLMGEAVHLHVPMLAVPIGGQYEQELNARSLARLGYGAWSRTLDADTLAAFLEAVPRHAAALEAWPSPGNEMALRCVDELVQDVALGEPAPERLESPSMGAWWGPPLPEEADPDPR